MVLRAVCCALPCAAVLAACGVDEPIADDSVPIESARHDHGVHKVKHVIVIMQENHSFDNYFGALAYAPGSPYHQPGGRDRAGCRAGDHRCVDGLSCALDAAGTFHCANANLDDDGSTVTAFHNPNRCVQPDMDHE